MHRWVIAYCLFEWIVTCWTLELMLEHTYVPKYEVSCTATCWCGRVIFKPLLSCKVLWRCWNMALPTPRTDSRQVSECESQRLSIQVSETGLRCKRYKRLKWKFLSWSDHIPLPIMLTIGSRTMSTFWTHSPISSWNMPLICRCD